MSRDEYFYPKTVAKCHETIDAFIHTNKTQAEEIQELRSYSRMMEQEKAKLEAHLSISTQKHITLLDEWHALKTMLRMLGREEKPE